MPGPPGGWAGQRWEEKLKTKLETNITCWVLSLPYTLPLIQDLVLIFIATQAGRCLSLLHLMLQTTANAHGEAVALLVMMGVTLLYV